ncbi:MAG TPA: protein-glutamate O-methyltransferase CheR [Pirellulales bacterium]|jgi:chemotaxis protein methyltransferase CheR|nr:protein-glutamate O-methyltransferase CheR [Pirellulales bacterium]
MTQAINALDADSFLYVSDLVHKRSAIVLEPVKGYLVESRLTPLARQHGFGTLQQMVSELRARSPGDLHHKVVEAMTTNETSFFRDIHPFETLKTEVLPKLIANRGSQRALNIWCGACSSGQEPYTIGMVIREYFPALATWNVKLVASDLSSQVLAQARQGLYSQAEVNRGLPASLLVKHFQKSGMQWQVKDNVRKLVQFMELNLIERWPPLPQMDVIFLRNVLIYFSTETKKSILDNVGKLLATDGFLFLGGAETTLNLDDSFERVNFAKTVCYRLRGK